MNVLNFTDYLTSFIYVVIIILIAFIIKAKRIEQNSAYNYFIFGIIAKIFAAFAFCIIHNTFYNSNDSDSFWYFVKAINFKNELFNSPQLYFSKLFELSIATNIAISNTIKLTSLFAIFSNNGLLTTTILISVTSFIATWKFYLLLCENYPKLKTEFAIACLFIPSVLFWGSGILKDTFTHAAALSIFYCFYRLFISKRFRFLYIIILIFSINILTSIKPYILFPLIFALFVSYSFFIFNKLRSILVRAILFPVISLIIFFSGGLMLDYSFNLIGGQYSDMDMVIGNLITFKEAMKVEGNSNYDLGKVEKSIPGILKKFPSAVVTGLNRPFFWEVKNLLMLMSSIENLLLSFLIIFVIFFVGPGLIIKEIFSNQLVMVLMVFSITFAFFVGLTSSNFGALTRFKIPLVPFFFSGLFILINHKIISIKKLHDCNGLEERL